MEDTAIRFTGDAEALAEISDLLEEVGSKNHVRVVKFEAFKERGRTRYREVMDVIHEVGAMPAALVRQDHLRMLAGLKPVYLAEAFSRLGGELISVSPNGRTTRGIDYAANALGASAQPSQADYIGLSNNTTATGASDDSNTLPWSSAQASDAAASGTTGEYTAIGVARKQATYAHTPSVASYTQTATWTATGTITSLQKAGLFGGSTKTAQNGATATNILFLENTFTATSLANNDQLSLTWTANI